MTDAEATRFLPGEIFAGRYRVVSLLGRGGMGEVYRADDLRLGQAVALKLLPPEFAHDPGRLERFVNEVRMALRVTHSNVCRVFDIGEWDGQHYLSMEYVDGEDLASLLRRIGRLHRSRAAEIGCQICAGLAAAHAEGVLHRDLKPANVMLDGRGRVKITDFGLAVRRSVEGTEARAGTPGYMAPEQVAGREISVQTDLYGLGLVLYEVFTGKRAFESSSEAVTATLEQAQTPPAPSSRVEDLDPAADRIILRCLEPDPAKRPESALAVGAALPGGDPALKRGVTPLPEEVGEMGEWKAMNPGRAAALALGSVLLLAVAMTLAGRNSVRARVPMDKEPAVLANKAREIVRELGYTEPVYAEPADTAFGYTSSPSALDWIEQNDSSPERWERLRNPRQAVIGFWYRQSPSSYLPREGLSLPPVGRSNPLPTQSGEILVGLDLEGRLDRLAVIGKPFDDRPEATVEPDWSSLLRLAGRDPSELTAVEPHYRGLSAPDRRAAWVGRLAEAPGHEERIEVGSYRGRPVQFVVLRPWELADLAAEPERATEYGAAAAASIGLILALLAVAALAARRNLRAGSADHRGALRLSFGILALLLTWAVLRTHAGLYDNPVLIVFALASALFFAALVGVFYLAFEPHARRDWPAVLVSWSRLLGGATIRWWDPTVGRSMLTGALIGAVASLFGVLAYALDALLAGGPARPTLGDWEVLFGVRATLAELVWVVADSTLGSVGLVLVLVGALFLVRHKIPAVALAGAFLIFQLLTLPGRLLGPIELHGPRNWTWSSGSAYFIVLTVVVVLGMVVLLRFGLVTMIVASIFLRLALIFPTSDWTAWHARSSRIALLAAAALAAYGCWAATRGGRRAVRSPHGG